MRFILFDFKKQSLQVFPFGMIDTNWVVHGMRQLAHDAHLLVGIGGCGETDSLKVVVAHRLTATEGQQQSTGAYLLHRPLVDIAVAFQSLLQAAVVLGKCGRVKNDEVELVVNFLHIFQHISHYSPMGCPIAEIQRHIAVAQFDGFLADVHRFHVVRSSAQGGKAEASRVAKAVQYPLPIGKRCH